MKVFITASSGVRKSEVDVDKNIERRLERYPMHMSKFIESGFITVDNTGDVNTTVDQILSALNGK